MRLEYWKSKVRASVPSWVYTQGENSVRLMDSLAAVFNEFEKNMLGQLAETFIETATGAFLDQHAAERGFEREEDESDDALRDRIRKFSANPDCATLRNEARTDIGYKTGGDWDTDARVYENNRLGFYVNGYAGEDSVLGDKEQQRNSFEMVVPEGPNLNKLIETINASKAFGIGWKLWVRGT